MTPSNYLGSFFRTLLFFSDWARGAVPGLADVLGQGENADLALAPVPVPPTRCGRVRGPRVRVVVVTRGSEKAS